MINIKISCFGRVSQSSAVFLHPLLEPGAYYSSTPDRSSADYCSPVTDDSTPFALCSKGNGKWAIAEEKMLVQLWCGQQTKLESTDARKTWEEIASAVSVNRVITSAQCQRKIKYLKTHYKRPRTQTEIKREAKEIHLPFMTRLIPFWVVGI